MSFEQWVAAFRAKAEAHGIAEATYTRVMTGMRPDMTGLTEIRNQPEFHEQLWQYLNRRVSDGRVGTQTMLAVQAYQRKIGMDPADGYAGLGLLARLRQGS